MFSFKFWLVLTLLFWRPKVDVKKPYKALVFDSLHDMHRGAIIYVACADGEIKRGDRITSYFSKKSYEVQEVGIARPNFQPTKKLTAGQVGYMICNMRSLKEAYVGDTIYLEKSQPEPFTGNIKPLIKLKIFLIKIYIYKGFKSPKPMVFKLNYYK